MVEQLASISAYLFFGMASLLAILELILPAKKPVDSINRRWSANIGLFLFGSALARLLVPLSAVAVSELSISGEIGLFHQWPESTALVILFAVLCLDLLSYIQHRVFHVCLPLWRLHMVHHTDRDIDFTTTVRHHPVEIAAGMAILYGFIVIMGIPAIAILLYALAESVVSLLSHANLRFPARLNRLLSLLIVTPAVHAVHHSAERSETDSNFGMVLTVWDRLFNTYRELAPGQIAPDVCGLEYFREPKDGNFFRLLYLPLLSIPAADEIGETAPGETHQGEQ